MPGTGNSPVAELPMSMRGAVRDIAPLWPAYHLVQVAQTALGQVPGGATLQHVAELAGLAAVFLALARRRSVRSA